ncbi:MAG: hypothetical protein JO112_14085, partial [Planctomycetes bacterium]|nr:hypothetical protein [Planctomycetota bacterium]
VYVQLHNRGVQAAANVTVKILYTDASAGLPDLPADFWTAFPGDAGDTSHWHPIGASQTISLLSPTTPRVLEWDWTPPLSAAEHSCLLVVMDCPADPIPATHKGFVLGTLVPAEKRVGLKNLHVVSPPPGSFSWTPFWFWGNSKQRHTIKLPPASALGWRIGFVFPKGQEVERDGFKATKLTGPLLEALKQRLGDHLGEYDTRSLYEVANPAKGGALSGVTLPKGSLQTMLLLVPSSGATAGVVSIFQETAQGIVGGSKFVLRPAQSTS